MKKGVFAVYDVVAAAYCHPFVSPTDAVAIRDFSFAVSDPESIISRSPSDYRLCLLGTFSDDTGLIEPLSQPSVLVSGSAFVVPVSPVNASNSEVKLDLEV